MCVCVSVYTEQNVLRVTVWGHRAQCDCVDHRKPTVNEQPGISNRRCMAGSLVLCTYVAESIRLHIVDML
jgi:hypothetical protein